MDQPRASVIIPARDAARTVTRAARSALAEPGVEVVVCDDGSTDGTADRLAALAGPRLTVVTNHAAAGPASARNAAASRARAPVLVFLDADDELVPDSVALRSEAFAADVGIVAGRVRVEGEATARTWPPPDAPAAPTRTDLLRANCLPTSGTAMRSDLFRELGGFDVTLRRCEDYNLWLRAAARAGVRLLPGVVAVLHRRAASLSTDLRAMLEARREMFTRLPLEVASSEEIAEAVARTTWELEALG